MWPGLGNRPRRASWFGAVVVHVAVPERHALWRLGASWGTAGVREGGGGGLAAPVWGAAVRGEPLAVRLALPCRAAHSVDMVHLADAHPAGLDAQTEGSV